MKKIDDNYFIDVNKKQTIDSLLSPNEKILWRGKPRKLSFILNAILKMLPIVIIWLAFDIFFIIMMINVLDNIPSFIIIVFIIFMLFHLLPVWIYISNVVTSFRRQKLEEYLFTDSRIIIKQGFIGSTIQSLNYESLVSVNLKIGIIERMCHVGDIYIVANNQRIVLEDIENPEAIYNKLQKIANDIKTDIIYPNAYRPKDNPGYKTSYNEKNRY